ncbi:MAG: glycerophosphodiester phosphodiesterase [Candidatus Binatia bacterium]|nr:glycerophosphodiester phosphodiesterase [Candidatus Binatia bacterium]
MQDTTNRLIVIAHRGASGLRPEHTLAAYDLAIEQGADFIEPDLVPTKDGVLIARHENALATVRLDDDETIVLDGQGRPVVVEATTNVAELPQFRDRLTIKRVDGVTIGGWFSEDFTLAEIKQLRARERIPAVRPHNTRFDDQFEIPTLAEVVALVQAWEKKGRVVGLYPETKHPTYFAQEGRFRDGTPINLSLGRLLVDTLVATGFTDPARVFIQSFEFANLLELRQVIMPAAGVAFPLVQLYGDTTDTQPLTSFSRPYDMHYNALQEADLRRIYGRLVDLVPGGITPTTGYRDLLSPAVIEFLAATYATGIGPWKNTIVPRLPLDGTRGEGPASATRLTGAVAPFLSLAIAAGLLVHPYTLRAEEQFLTTYPNGIPQSGLGEVVQLLSLGVHGFFTDHPAIGVLGRDLFLRLNRVTLSGVEEHLDRSAWVSCLSARGEGTSPAPAVPELPDKTQRV